MIKSGESLEYVVDSLINERRIKTTFDEINRFEIIRSASRNSISPLKSSSGSTLAMSAWSR
jgi:hypothetical protein